MDTVALSLALPCDCCVCLFDALSLAMHAHQGQIRFSGVDFIAHPVLAVHEVLRAGESTPLTLAATLLQDVLTENPHRMRLLAERIEAIGGVALRDIVELLTEHERNLLPQRVRRTRLLERLRIAASHEAWMAALAGRAAALQDIPIYCDRDWLNSYLDDSKALLDASCEIRTPLRTRLEALIAQVCTTHAVTMRQMVFA